MRDEKKIYKGPKKYHAQLFIHRTAGGIAHGFIFLALELYLAGTQRLSFGLLSKNKLGCSVKISEKISEQWKEHNNATKEQGSRNTSQLK
jgi:hypothetical protein